MSKDIKRTVIGYVVSITIAGLIALGVGFVFDFGETKQDAYKALCDTFSVPALLYMAVAVLCWIGRDGFFDGISFTLHRALAFFLPFLGSKTETYRDYKEIREERRALSGGSVYTCLFLTGLLFLAIALVFLVLWYNA